MIMRHKLAELTSKLSGIGNWDPFYKNERYAKEGGFILKKPVHLIYSIVGKQFE